jgi:hypothetical protein
VIIGALGTIPFVAGYGTANTFHEIAKQNKYSFVKHAIFGGGDLIESTGYDPLDLSVHMKFFAPYTLLPKTSIEKIEQLMALKSPVPLIAGDAPVGRTGSLLTLFVVESASVRMTKFSGGQLTIAELDVKLLEYANPFSLAGPLGALAGLGTSIAGKIF